MLTEIYLAPCGVACRLCMAFQRKRKPCVGCLREGPKPNHCAACAIKECPEKRGDPSLSCGACGRFPCRRIRDLSKRYAAKYGEDLVALLRRREDEGLRAALDYLERRWRCPSCGDYLCMHDKACGRCGADNPRWPERLSPVP